VREEHEYPLPLRSVEVSDEIHEITADLVIVLGDPVGPVAEPELEQQGPQVVGKAHVINPGVPQGVTHDHVEEQGRGRPSRHRGTSQELRQAGRVQQPVGALLRQQIGVVPGSSRLAPPQQVDGHIEVVRGQTLPKVRANHLASSCA